MSLQDTLIGPGYVARIDGLAPGKSSPSENEKLKGLLHKHKVILIRGQHYTPEDYLALARSFGELEPFFISDYSLKDHPEIYILSNVRVDGTPLGRDGAGTHWHSDSTFTPRPSAATFLQAIKVPKNGGDTLFADCQASYDALDPPMKDRLEGLRAIHRYQKKEYLFTADDTVSRSEAKAIRALQQVREQEEKAKAPSPTARMDNAVPEQKHPLVRTHPVTGKKGLFLNAEMMVGIEGVKDIEAQELIKMLCLHATKPEFQYRHQWQKGDIVIWDNASVIHAATFTPPDEDRIMYRLTTKGDVPS
ncbi:TauD/TfdA dioxygenase family protein [Aestuariispira insulae]|uniref:Taurine dioxygenase n=1 Tax=Aestuariispira insulae TaxID=1461337 RepID=A0A3D9HUP4_9PROT|nr:TauD/TfdA family dioxygenase [Aestuariispira insulae]RED53234.1 taurine dioxygenase [Aestuariispira insulae]